MATPTMNAQSFLSKFWRWRLFIPAHVWALFLHIFLVLVFTWPVLIRLNSHFAGARSDLWVHQWTFWWVKEALSHGSNPFYTTMLYYPEGVSLASHNIAWFNIALWLLLQTIFSEIAAYNLIYLAILSLNGFATHLFVYEISRSRVAAIVSGIVCSFWPYTLSHYDHPNMIIVFWVPLTMLFLRKAVVLQTKSAFIATALSLAMIGISRWQHLVMSAPIIAGYLFYLLITQRRVISSYLLFRLCLTGIAALVLMAPLALPMLSYQIERDHPEDLFISEPDSGRTDLLAYVVHPDLYDRLWQGEFPHPHFVRAYNNIAASFHYVPFLGYATLVLTMLGVGMSWRQSRFWLALALGYMLMALGPQLAINAYPIPNIPMPYQLLEDTILGGFIRRPHRLNIFLSIPIAVLAGYGANALTTKTNQWLFYLTRLQGRGFVTFLLAAIILLENNPAPFPTTFPRIPIWQQQLAQDPDNYAILNLPTHNRHYDKWYMFYQTMHGKPLVEGHISRMPREAYQFIDTVPLLREIFYTNNNPDFDAIGDSQAQFDLLAKSGVRYVVLHRQFIHPHILPGWEEWIDAPIYYEDQELIVYRTDSGPYNEVEIYWDNQIVLYGYDLRHSLDSLAVTLYWQRLASMDNSYKMFIHLVDAETGIRLGQVDTVPQVWQHPTTSWVPHEQIEDTFIIPLPKEKREYVHLWLGWYDEDTGQRLPISPHLDLLIQDNAILFATLDY